MTFKLTLSHFIVTEVVLLKCHSCSSTVTASIGLDRSQDSHDNPI